MYTKGEKKSVCTLLFFTVCSISGVFSYLDLMLSSAHVCMVVMVRLSILKSPIWVDGLFFCVHSLL